MTINYPADYYNRWHSDGAGSNEEQKGYDEHLFIAGNVGQSSEINEIQSRFKTRLRDLGNHLLKDGDITSGGDLIITPSTGGMVSVLAKEAKIWLYGAVRHIPERTFLAPAAGTVQVGVWLTESVVTADADQTLRDPAIGLRLVGEVGAARVRVACVWGHSTDGQSGNFYSIHRVLNGVLLLKKEPPESNAVALAISRYDRQSTGGSYVSSGFRVTAVPGDNEDYQVYSLSAGVARVMGSEIITEHAQTLEYVTAADLDTVDEEQYDSTGLAGQIVYVRHWPVAVIDRITVVKSVVDENVIRSSLGNTDLLAHTSIVAVSAVVQGATTFVAGVDYNLSNDAIVWLNAPPPTAGSTYTVSYTYNKNIKSTATITADGKGIVIPETNISGTNQIEVGYQYKLPRIDRVCLDQDGVWHIVKGVSSRRQNPIFPQIPQTYIGLASIYQKWVPGERTLQNDAPRMISMARLENHDRDIAVLFQLVAANNLANDLSAREPLGRRGLYTDPFLSDNSRDPGTPQTAQISNQVLSLGVQGAAHNIHIDPVTLIPDGELVRVDQPLSSDAMQINPYMVFSPPKTYAYLSPWWDFWTAKSSINTVTPDDYVDVYTYTETEETIVTDVRDQMKWRTGTPPTVRVSKERTTTLISDTLETLTDTRIEDAKFMRAIDVQFTLINWGSNENLVDVKIDGRSIAFEERIP